MLVDCYPTLERMCQVAVLREVNDLLLCMCQSKKNQRKMFLLLRCTHMHPSVTSQYLGFHQRSQARAPREEPVFEHTGVHVYILSSI